MLDLSQPYVGEYIELYEIDATDIGGNIYRLAPSLSYDDVTGIVETYVFGGQSYMAIPCEFTGFNSGTNGAPSTPAFTISNLQRQLWGEILTLDGLVGSHFTRRRTFTKYTKQGGNATDEEMTPHVFAVSQITQLSRESVAFKLASPIDQEGSKLPFRQVLKDGDEDLSFPGVSRRQTR